MPWRPVHAHTLFGPSSWRRAPEALLRAIVVLAFAVGGGSAAAQEYLPLNARDFLPGLDPAPGYPIGVGGEEVLFRRGDANLDGLSNLADPIFLINYLFAGQNLVLSCEKTGDVNADNSVNVADVIYSLTFLLLDGPAIMDPFDSCGLDDESVLSCLSYPPCGTGTIDRAFAGHLLRRLGYGPTPAELDRVQSIGSFAYIAEQLQPELIDESQNVVLNQAVQALDDFTSDRNDLRDLQVVRGLYSQAQLREQLTDFWSNHFNTHLGRIERYFRELPVYDAAQGREVAAYYEWHETELFRSRALGHFVDLLTASATSPSMLIYLDSVENLASDPNENYARELCELHGMGVDNGYTQADIEEIARCFSGWTICKKSAADFADPLAPCLPDNDPSGVWTFHFDGPNHDYGEKTIFAQTAYELVIPARQGGDGLLDGLEVIARISTLPQTAEFVSGKLIAKFVSDEVPASLLADCVAAWLETDGHLGSVLQTIFYSDEFLGQANRWNKLETPMESILSTMRALEGTYAGGIIRSTLSRLGHLPFNFSSPDGFPEVDDLGTSKVLERIRFSSRIYLFNNPSFDVVALLEAAGVSLDNNEAVVDYFLDLFYQGNHTPAERQLCLDFLSTDDLGSPSTFTPGTGAYATQVEKLVAFIASFPQGNQQ